MIKLNLNQVQHLLTLFGGMNAEVSIDECEGQKGKGVYAWFKRYPDEGKEKLDPNYGVAEPQIKWSGDIGFGKAGE